MSEQEVTKNGEIGMQVYEEPTSTPAIFSDDPEKAIAKMESVVGAISKKCKGEKYISEIKGKKYPRVEWWTTVGAVLGLFPVVEWSKRLDREDEIAYEARVSVKRGDQVITAGEAICTSKERNWKDSDEYAIKSMAQTRATGKAYRNGLAMIAKMAGLEGTPAEEMVKKNEDEEKIWLDETKKTHWSNAEKKVKSGEITAKDLRNHYKVSRANMEYFQTLEDERRAEIDQEFDNAEDLQGTPYE